MATSTIRSSRRAKPDGADTIVYQNKASQSPKQLTISRPKRSRRSSETDQDSIIAKRARTTNNVEPRVKAQIKNQPGVIKSNATSDVFPQRSTQNTAAVPQSNGATARQPPKHTEKAINGIKHELERLQPAAADIKDDKRKLRSQEGTRFKSELSAYFPDYDVVIGNETEETHFLNVETPIIIVDSNPSLPKPQQPTSPKARLLTNGKPQQPQYRQFADSLFTDLYQTQRVDFSFLDKLTKSNPNQPDPLQDSYYNLAHRRAERLEKSIRNSEKGRAQHEKDQVIRLLEGLQGHDWLKVMGVSGITESKKKDFEPAREYFIKGCQAILEKFRNWREEEKRRKLEKERAQAEIAEAEAEAEAEADGVESDGDPPDYSDVDHAAAMQLHEEAIARSAPITPTRRPGKRVKIELISEPLPPKEEKELKSFFKKPHLRQAALGKQRRSGRSVSAWGHPIPDVPEADFELPEEYRDAETLAASARRRRRGRRDSKV